MKLEMIFEDKNKQSSLSNVIKFLNRKLNVVFLQVPGIEHFKNALGPGFGIRYIKSGSRMCIRFNWKNESIVGRPFSIHSIDIFTGKTKGPSFNFTVDGMPIVKALPILASTLSNLKVGIEKVFPVSERKALENILSEAIAVEEQLSLEKTIDKFLKDAKSGKFYSRDTFINEFGLEHLGMFDAIIKQFKDEFSISNGILTLSDGANINKIKKAILASAASVQVTKFDTSKEVYLSTKQEVEIANDKKISYEDSLEHLSSLVDAVAKGTFNALFVTGKGGTGKTQTVENVLRKNGLSDGHGYFKNTGTASAAGIFTLLYRHRKDIILFDDSDGALSDQDARNILKAATDTKSDRKLVWNKKASFIFDPEKVDPLFYADDLTMVPRYFNFKGRIIFISNLPLEKLDPDGALRTRAFIINIDPTTEELFDFMEKILFDIKLENNAKLSNDRRKMVLQIVKNSKNKDEISLRKLVRALNLAASNAPNWPVLVELYS